MNAIKRTLRNLSFAYFFKNYVFAALIAAVLFYYVPTKDAPTISLIIINFIFYPFAVCVWDNLRDLFFGNLYLWATGTFILLLFGIKILIKMILFMLALPLGILGFLLLMFLTRNEE